MCEDLIAAGRVTVNGEVAVLGRRVDPDVDLVEVDGAPVGTKPGLVHYLLNKPPGVVTTAKDTHGRPTVVELVPAEPRVFPVGRLDADTEGLLLLTNDGELANRIAHPRHGLEKEYLASVGRRAGQRRARCAGCATASSSTTASTAPAKVSQPEPGRAADHDPRGPQPPGPADVRRPSATRSSASCGPASARCPTAASKPGAWRALDPGRGPRPRRSHGLTPGAARTQRQCSAPDESLVREPLATPALSSDRSGSGPLGRR